MIAKRNKASLEEILQQTWHSLEEALHKTSHPFRTPVLGTTSAEGCQLRTVVLREFHREERLLVCYSDMRAAKIREIRENPSVSWLFYNPGTRIQLRIEALASIHQGEETLRHAWEKTPPLARFNYRTVLPPGTPLNMEQNEGNLSFGQSDEETGWSNFAMIENRIRKLDWLHLDAQGHSRAQFSWTAEGVISAIRVVP